MGKIRCPICNQKKKLSLHHLDGNHLNNKEGNMIKVCESCHQKLHAIKDKQNTDLALPYELVCQLVKEKKIDQLNYWAKRKQYERDRNRLLKIKIHINKINKILCQIGKEDKLKNRK